MPCGSRSTFPGKTDPRIHDLPARPTVRFEAQTLKGGVPFGSLTARSRSSPCSEPAFLALRPQQAHLDSRSTPSPAATLAPIRERGEALLHDRRQGSARACLCALSAQTRRRPCGGCRGRAPAFVRASSANAAKLPNDKTYAGRPSRARAAGRQTRGAAALWRWSGGSASRAGTEPLDLTSRPSWLWSLILPTVSLRLDVLAPRCGHEGERRERP
jgi:hypothetical protein